MPEPVVLFVQQRTGKSGAPVALSRLLAHPELKSLRPVLLVGREGWLTKECEARGVPFITLPFPPSRTLLARVWGNRRFAERVAQVLDARGLRPRVVIGNDHLEGLLIEAIARCFQAARAIFLRSSEITERDFRKYHCGECDRVFVVLDEMRERVQPWSPRCQVRVVTDGLNASEFLPPKAKAPAFPAKVLVVGSESHYKGWQDFAAAVDRLEQIPDFPALECDFTGQAPASAQNDMRLNQPRRARFNFIGRVERFRELVRQYDLVIHPSRQESFGLAMVEVLATGVPLFCSRTGVIEQIQTNPAMLFPPEDSAALARQLEHLWRHWPTVDPGVAACQEILRRRFLMDTIARQFAQELQALWD